MNGNWTESQERVVRLPEDKPEIFELYLELLYTNQIPVVGIEKDSYTTQFMALTRLYVLSERLCDVKSKNSIVAAMIAGNTDSGIFPIGHSIRELYSETPANSPARRLYARLFASSARPEMLENNHEGLLDDFWFDITHGFIKLRGPGQTVRLEDFLEKEEEQTPSG